MVSVHDLTVYAQITSILRTRGASLFAIDLKVSSASRVWCLVANRRILSRDCEVTAMHCWGWCPVLAHFMHQHTRLSRRGHVPFPAEPMLFRGRIHWQNLSRRAIMNVLSTASFAESTNPLTFRFYSSREETIVCSFRKRRRLVVMCSTLSGCVLQWNENCSYFTGKTGISMNFRYTKKLLNQSLCFRGGFCFYVS